MATIKEIEYHVKNHKKSRNIYKDSMSKNFYTCIISKHKGFIQDGLAGVYFHKISGDFGQQKIYKEIF